MKSPLLYLLTMSFICMADTIHPYPVGEVCGTTNRTVIIDKYIIEKERDDIYISYPMILGLDNAEIINKLVREHIYKVIDRRKAVILNHYNFKMRYKYEVEFFNGKFLSIRYEGWWEAKKRGIRRTGRTHTVNIDIEEEKIVSKKDMVKDSDQVFKLLMENQFESVQLDGEEAKPYYSPGDLIRQKEGLEASHLDYYITRDKFVVTRQNAYDYTEYAIGIDEIKEYLNEDMVRKLSGFAEKRDSVEGQSGVDPYVEEAKDLPERKEDTSISERGKNTVTRDANGRITIHITTKEPDREHR